MKPHDILKLAIQIVWVYFLFQAANLLVEFATGLMFGGKAAPFLGMLVHCLLRIVAALYFLRGAPPFLSWAYPREQ